MAASSERHPKNRENASNWRIASEVVLPIPPLQASADLGPVPLNDLSADLALRRDTPFHPVASRAEPPNSAQPFPIRSDQMPQLIPNASSMAANVAQTNLTKVQKIWQPMPARYRKAIVSKQMSL
jgi:hypothetical protein